MPFEREEYLSFCIETCRKFNCGQVIHIGDLVDNHTLSYHEHHPDGYGPLDEIRITRERIKLWANAFPNLMVCKGNHDILMERQAITHGFSTLTLRSYQDIWELPKTWQYEWSFVVHGVRYEHGTGYGGLYPQAQAAKNNRQNTVIGHCHSVAGVIWDANDTSLIFGLSVGSGIDRKKYTFWYGRDFKHKPILGAGVVLDFGKEAQFVPMKI